MASWSDRSGIAAACDADESCDAAPETRWELFSIVREALHNIERHAHADKVRVVLGFDGDDIVLTIADDGDGFEIPRSSRSSGTAVISESSECPSARIASAGISSWTRRLARAAPCG